MRIVVWAFCLLIANPPLVLAAAGHSTSELMTSGMRVVGALVLVLGVMFIIYAVAKKRLKFLPGQRHGTIQVIEMRYLAPKKAVALVKVRGQELLVGVGQDQVNLILKLDSSHPFEETLQEKLGEQA